MARNFSHPSISTAYDCAITLMQDVLIVAPGIDVQHSQLVAKSDAYEMMPFGHAIHIGQSSAGHHDLGTRTSLSIVRDSTRFPCIGRSARLQATEWYLANKFWEVHKKLQKPTSSASSQ